MLVYLNSAHSIPLGSVIEIPKTMVLFMERIDAVVDRQLQEETKGSLTYKCIIDEPIHDPLVIAQNDSIYQPNDIGLYPDYDSGGLPHDEFMKKITSVKHSKEIFLTEKVLEQIGALGFAGVWIFDMRKRNIITINAIKSLVIEEIK
jgi:hypothetical protein